MDFKQLEAFAAVVDTNSFSEAAKRLYLTQPTISAHIRSLESELGVKLIVRTTKSIRITKEGYRLYDYARDILKLRQRACDELNNASETILHIGASTIPSAYVLPACISDYRKKHPNIRFNIVQADSIAIINKFPDNGVDLAVVGTQISSPRLLFEPLMRDEIVLAAPNTPQFAALKAAGAPLSELLRHPIIMREYGSGTKKEADLLLAGMGIESTALNIAAYTNDQEAIKAYIRSGTGISVISRKAVERAERDGTILTFSLGKYASYRTLYLVTLRGYIYPKHVREFIDYLKQRGEAEA